MLVKFRLDFNCGCEWVNAIKITVSLFQSIDSKQNHKNLCHLLNLLYSYIFCFRVEGLVKLLLLSDLYYCCLMTLEWPLWSVGLFFSPRAICRRLWPLAIHFVHQNMLNRYFKDDLKQMLMIKKKKSYNVVCTWQSLMLDL